MYDIWIITGGTALPDISELSVELPLLQDEQIKMKMTQKNKGFFGVSPGFLGLSMTKPQAERLMALIKPMGARGYIVLETYRHPTLSIEDAKNIAQQQMDILLNNHPYKHTFAPAVLDRRREQARWWTFVAPSKYLQDEGYIPGALFTFVDKMDGHIWSDTDIKDFFQTISYE